MLLSKQGSGERPRFATQFEKDALAFPEMSFQYMQMLHASSTQELGAPSNSLPPEERNIYSEMGLQILNGCVQQDGSKYDFSKLETAANEVIPFLVKDIKIDTADNRADVINGMQDVADALMSSEEIKHLTLASSTLYEIHSIKQINEKNPSIQKTLDVADKLKAVGTMAAMIESGKTLVKIGGNRLSDEQKNEVSDRQSKLHAGYGRGQFAMN